MVNYSCNECAANFTARAALACPECAGSDVVPEFGIGTVESSDIQEDDNAIQGILLNLSDAISHSSHSPLVWARIIERAIEMLKDEKAEIDPDAYLLSDTHAALSDMIKEYRTKHTIGRPTIFNVDVATKILARIEEGEALYSITKDPELPSKGTIINWTYQFPEFGEAYRQARKQHAHLLLDGALEAAEECSDTDKLKIQKARLVHQARLNLAERMNPAEFGGKVSIQGVVHHLTHEDRVRELQARRDAEEIGIKPMSQITPASDS